MYHYTNQPIYNHEVYQQCSVDETNKNLNVTCDNAENGEYNTRQEIGSYTPLDRRHVPMPTDIRSNVIGKSEKFSKTTIVDTSNFSIEERLVAAVWVHERKRTNTGMSQIKHDFRLRFGREPPAKNTLLAWERKMFTTGSVRDAPRPGRPVKRVSLVSAVLASLAAAPALSLRGRARALRLPPSTLRAILRRDVPPPPAAPPAAPAPTPAPANKRSKSTLKMKSLPASTKSSLGPPMTAPTLPN